MNLLDELAGTLRDRAETVTPPPGLAARTLARGHALRRRRRIASAAVAPALVVVAVVTATTFVAGGDRAAPQPARTPPPTSVPTVLPTVDGPLPEGPEPARPYALSPSELRPRGSVRVGRYGYAVQPGQGVERLVRAGSGVVAELSGAAGGEVWYYGADGRPRHFAGLAGSVAVSPSGGLLAAPLPHGAPGGSRMYLTEIASGRTVATLPGDRAPLAFADEDRVVFLEVGTDTAPGALGIWRPSDGSVTPVPDVAVPVTAALEAAPDGRTVLIADDNEVRAVNLEGAVRWTRPGRYWEGPAMAFSPDGRWLALAEDGGLVVLGGDVGNQVAEVARFDFEAVGVAWTDARTVLVSARSNSNGGYGDQRLTCRVDRLPLRCEGYEPFDAVLPD
jgi:hypothetical protein